MRYANSLCSQKHKVMPDTKIEAVTHPSTNIELCCLTSVIDICDTLSLGYRTFSTMNDNFQKYIFL